MKNSIFTLFTVCSIIFFGFTNLLLFINFTDENPGMIMLYLIPFLLIGLATGFIAILMNNILKLEIGPLVTILHGFNIALFVGGIIAAFYIF